MVPGWVLKRFLYWRVIRLRVERTGGSEGNGFGSLEISGVLGRDLSGNPTNQELAPIRM
jgi:hypothetical protein